MTLFEKFDNTLSDELIGKLGSLSERKLGDTEGATRAIFYTLLAGLIRRANSDMSTNMLVNQISKIAEKNFEGLDFEKELSTKNGIERLIEIGNNHMSQIFPSFKSQLVNLITAYSGTSKEETSNLTGFVNVMIVKYLSDDIKQGTDKDDLMNYLKGHRDMLFEQAPESLVEKMIPAMGMHELRKMKLTYAKKQEERNAAKAKEKEGAEPMEVVESDPAEEEESSSGITTRVLLILAAVAVTGLLGYLIYDSREELFGASETQATEVLVEDLPEITIDSLAADSVALDVNPGITAIKEILAAPQVDANLQIRLESLNFENGATELTGGPYAVVDTLLAEFKRNPRFQIQIRGGDSNRDTQTAIKRAFSLKRILQQNGVDPIRIDAVSDPENLDYLKIRIVSK